MFENQNEKNVISESLGNLVYLAKENPVLTLIYNGAVPFGMPYILRGSLNTGFALQAYLLTTMVFVDVPFRTRKLEVKRRWFWKAIVLTGVILHPVFLTGMWYADLAAASQSLAIGGATLFLLLFVAGALEIIVLGAIVDRYRPDDRDEPSKAPTDVD